MSNNTKQLTVEEWKYAHLVNELREARKLLNVFQTYGNVLVNGNMTVSERMHQLVGQFKDAGMDSQETDKAIAVLEKYYPVKII